jgi:moderate conductance mechanosensitive channel
MNLAAITFRAVSEPMTADESRFTWEAFLDWLLDAPLRVTVVIIAAVIIDQVARRAIDRTVAKIIARNEWTWTSAITDVRAEARAHTISSVAKSSLRALVWTITTLVVLAEFGVSLAPLIAGAGIAGVALGFGAQSLVKDCITGLFMLAEDQYGVGDSVDLGEAVGTVEAVTLRTTRLRSVDGTVWHVPNGVITRVGNRSQLWSMALLDIDVAYGTDLDMARTTILGAAEAVCALEDFVDDVLEPPQVLGVERLGADGVTLRLTVKTNPGQQWALMRAIRQALTTAYQEAGLEFPFPQRTVWMRQSRPEP